MSQRFVLGSTLAAFLCAGTAFAADPLPPVAKPVTLMVKEKPFNEVVEKLAEEYDLSVVIAPQAGDARTGFVTARLKNVPVADALELLAVQCDLRVIRKGNAFLITNRDHANDLFNEKLERERQLIELKQLREAPPLRFGPGGLGNQPPAPKAEPKAEPKAAGTATLQLQGNGVAIPLQFQLVKPQPKVEPKAEK
jgi:hypothetical protein